MSKELSVYKGKGGAASQVYRAQIWQKEGLQTEAMRLESLSSSKRLNLENQLAEGKKTDVQSD